MPVPALQAVPEEPYLLFELDRAEAHHLLRALSRAAASAVREATPDEKPLARAAADAYDALRDRLLEDVARRDLEHDEEDAE